MDLSRSFQRMIQFLSGAIARIFGPTDDNYPNCGVQPFEGEPEKHQSEY
jgi:hypothetical protein